MNIKTLPITAFRAAYIQKLRLLRYRIVRLLATLLLMTRPITHTVYVWPPIDNELDQDEYNSLIKNLRHYLKNIEITVEYYLITAEGLNRCKIKAPFDTVYSSELVDKQSVTTLLKKAKFCLLWKLNGTRIGSSVRPHLYVIKRGLDCCDANEWLRLTKDVYCTINGSLPDNFVAFPKYPVNTCAIIGSGPSFENFIKESVSYDTWICANNVVCDIRMRSLPNPFAICVLDPYIFSSLESMQPTIQGIFCFLRETQAVMITTLDFAAYIELNFPSDIKRKCHYVSTLGHDTARFWTNSDLQKLAITPYGNVLTDLMIPVAAAISRDVVLYGCDGREPGEKGFFLKGTNIAEIDDKQTEDLKKIINEDVLDKYIFLHNLYTRYVVDEFSKQQVTYQLRCPSWNTGLQHLTLASEKDCIN